MRFPTRERKVRDGREASFLLDGDIGVGEVILLVEWSQTMHCFLAAFCEKFDSVLGFDGVATFFPW